VLIGLAARLDAATSDAAIALARRYANILTGEDPDDDDGDTGAPDDDEDADPGEADEADGPGRTGDTALGHVARDHRNAASANDTREYDVRDIAARVALAYREPGRDDEIGGDAEREDEIGHGGAEGSGQPEAGGDADAGGSAENDGEMGSGGGATAGMPGALALLDAEQAPPDLAIGVDANAAAASAGALEGYEAWIRRHRPSLWGRLDLGVAWRQHWSQPRYAPARRSDEVWLFATWRR